MVAIKSFLFFTIAGAAVPFSWYQEDLSQVDRDCTAGTKAVSGSSNISTASNSLSTLDKDIKFATTDCRNTPVTEISRSDCQSIISYTNNTLEPDLKAFLNALASRANGYQGAICNSVKTVKADFDSLWSCPAAACPSFASSYQQTQAKVDSDFNAAASKLC